MRSFKKLLAVLAMVCMLTTGFSMITYAAEGELRFTDPSTTVGAEVEVTAVFTAPVLMDQLEATLTYDPAMLKFVSGDSATGGNGTVTISGDGGSATEASFTLTFQALAEGDASIEVSSSSGVDAVGDPLDLINGSSKVSVGPGDPSLIQEEEGQEEESASMEASANGPQVEVDGQQYTITSGFSDALIPVGFVRGETQYEGTSCESVTQEASGRSAFYLTPVSGGEPDFFLYDSDNGTFAPFEQVELSADRYIVLLRSDGKVDLPDTYQETTLTLNGKEFPVWQNTEEADYYVIYALNADGEEGLYQYDTVDRTYQRYVKNAASADSNDSGSTPGGIWGKILSVIRDFLDIIVIVAGAVFLALVIILIVVAVKLRHRNLELDDLYDEYGIDLDEDEEEEKPARAKSRSSESGKSGPAVRKPAQTAQIVLDDEDDFDDFEDFEDYEEEEFDDYGAVDLDEDDFEDDYEEFEDEDDDIIDDLDELLSKQPKKRRGHMEPDDTFKVDIIDLD